MRTLIKREAKSSLHKLQNFAFPVSHLHSSAPRNSCQEPVSMVRPPVQQGDQLTLQLPSCDSQEELYGDMHRCRVEISPFTGRSRVARVCRGHGAVRCQEAEPQPVQHTGELKPLHHLHFKLRQCLKEAAQGGENCEEHGNSDEGRTQTSHHQSPGLVCRLHRPRSWCRRPGCCGCCWLCSAVSVHGEHCCFSLRPGIPCRTRPCSLSTVLMLISNSPVIRHISRVLP